MPKLTLAITEVKEVQEGERKDGKGKWQKLSFKARNGNGEHWYNTFTSTLFPAITPGQTIEADVTETESDRGTDRKVTQVYVNGAAVGSRSQGRQGYTRQDSPENRASIESQVAFKGVVELMVGNIISKDEILGKAAMAWALSRLGDVTITVGVPVVVELKKTKTDMVKADEEAGAVEGKQELPVMTTSKEFYDACKLQLGLKVTDTSKLISQSQEINEAFNSKDFTTAFRLAKETAGK